MNGSKASYAFLPWIRRGISAIVDQGALRDGRLTIPVELSFGPSRQATARLSLFGPGEVTGLDPRVVIRTWPTANVHDAEPNYFPMVEFDQFDLPWRYTPAAAPDNDRLQPWLCLIVLKDEEIGGLVPPSGTRPLPVVAVARAPLPLLDQAWAWAHVQVAGVETITPAEAADLLATEPHRLVSRLLCPRRLDPKTRYTACLVPTFESGRCAGIGQPADEEGNPLAPAWTSGTQSLQLPVYYQWRFTTGVAGDFEDLVKRLKPARLPATVGLRPMNVHEPGAGLPPAAAGPLGLEGALRALSTESTPWPVDERELFVEALRRFLNRPAELLQGSDGVRAVAPPLYGQWHAAQDRLAPGQEPVWFQEANGDPRWRAAAGLGTQVIQANQRQLMASAWQQAPGLADINDKLRLTQLARELAARLHQRHLDQDDDELVLQVTAPVHGRVRASPVTIAAQIQESPIAEGAIGTGWRRVTRPNGPIGRRQNRPAGERSQLLARLNRGELSPALPPPTPSGMATPSRTRKSLAPSWINPTSVSRLRELSRQLPVIGWLLGGLADRIELRLADLRLAVRESLFTRPNIEAIPAQPRFVATESELVGGRPPTSARPVEPAADTPAARAFRAALAAMQDQIDAEIVPEAVPKKIALRELRNKLVANLDPAETIGKSVRRRLQFADRLQWRVADPLEPILVGPDFPQPMYRALTELSQDWLLPGLEQVPVNSVSLVETNQRFVEAYMLGLNHEMGHELLWHEYPTDQRRTYFRQFWDPSGFVPSNGQPPSPEQFKDIEPIHHWEPAAALGGNSGRKASAKENLVLLVRGDVLHRYPNLLVYAARAVWNAENKRDLGAEEQQPIFSGLLKPDVAFFGFRLTEAQARGDSTAPGQGDPGWFFVLQEQLTEPRFGLDFGEPGDANKPGAWNDLHWGHLVAEALTEIDYIDLDAQRPDTRSINDPPKIAWHADQGLGRKGTRASHLAFITLQRPVRVAIHAADMLPA